jgi:hypothetical protein
MAVGGGGESEEESESWLDCGAKIVRSSMKTKAVTRIYKKSLRVLRDFRPQSDMVEEIQGGTELNIQAS